MQGAVLRVKMRHIEKWTEARRAAARRYDQAFAGSGIETPPRPTSTVTSITCMQSAARHERDGSRS